MSAHPIRQVIAVCDQAISERNFDELMKHYAPDAALVIKPGMIVRGKDNIRKAFIAISDHFKNQLVVEQGVSKVLGMLWLLWKRCCIFLMSRAAW
ncbi:Uncharacterised protein [Yersinia enterocolitica]|nr:Uncharacterised protein [Yersinia enterocolitica]